MDFLKILTATIPVFLMVGVGFATRRLGIIHDASEKSIMRLVVNVLYPCFILSKVPGNESLDAPSLVLIAIGCGCGLVLTGYLVAWSFGWLAGIRPEDGLSTFSVSSAIQNYGFIPIPLIIALFPETSDPTLGVLFVHNLGLEIAMWTIGIVLLSGTFSGALRRLINGPTVAIFLGLTLNYTGIYAFIPSFVAKTIADLGGCAIPISVVLVGATLAGVIEREQWRTKWKVISTSMLVRFAIMPLLFCLVASQMSFSLELQRVLIVQAAMPAAIFPIVLARHYGGEPDVAVQIVIATSLVSLLMTPLILAFGLQFLEISP